MGYLGNYLKAVCGFEKNEKGHAGPASGKRKAAFDASKTKHLIEELYEPMFIHVCACVRSPHILREDLSETGYIDSAKGTRCGPSG